MLSLRGCELGVLKLVLVKLGVVGLWVAQRFSAAIHACNSSGFSR